jgi:hypothetical protein
MNISKILTDEGLISIIVKQINNQKMTQEEEIIEYQKLRYLKHKYNIEAKRLLDIVINKKE